MACRYKIVHATTGELLMPYAPARSVENWWSSYDQDYRQVDEVEVAVAGGKFSTDRLFCIKVVEA